MNHLSLVLTQCTPPPSFGNLPQVLDAVIASSKWKQTVFPTSLALCWRWSQLTFNLCAPQTGPDTLMTHAYGWAFTDNQSGKYNERCSASFGPGPTDAHFVSQEPLLLKSVHHPGHLKSKRFEFGQLHCSCYLEDVSPLILNTHSQDVINSNVLSSHQICPLTVKCVIFEELLRRNSNIKGLRFLDSSTHSVC